ncbi:hypothetical protein F66182_1110 [Fusarium sp. NRRL 66182]|nr:hypothetical protein F66182_1110 [Fusarium sp. NRRL 66182]
MASRFSNIAFLAVALCLLCLGTFSNADTTHHPHGSHARIHRRNVITKAPVWAKKITNSPGHQNPAKAPPNPIEDVELSAGKATSLQQYYKDAKNASESLMGVTPNKSHNSRRSLEKRGSGALYCKDGPCADDSCCGPDSICGYGPDFCGDGCTSNCDATAMCGEYSEEGEMPCGMNLCCSSSGWCGTTEVFCDNADPLHKTLPCQAGYGSCNIASSPSCAKGGGSTNGRTIGYYQSWNVRTRKCDTKTPKQLDTKGFTHLFYSFAFIDPTSFKITPAHDDDAKQMREFTDLSKDGKLKTWIAVGGFDMSNEEAATHTTWSDMVSTKANRAAFIESARDYMDEYGFTGIDLDWEYPGEPKRGGRKLADTRNFSMLLREMRAAYGDKYGISLTLAPDYWYLRWFDAKAMEPYVDFFGFMAYDLHGSWDSDVRTLGKIIRGQADIREIGNNTIPLWFDGLDPKKINFGLAMYGRGYTVADKSCNALGCSFAGPSKKGECTDSDGVMSLGEIKNLIKNKGVKSTYLKDAMMKQVTWDDQWIGYDDEETFADKKAWADGYCFGGTMIWSIDFQASGSSSDSGSGPNKGTVPALPATEAVTIPKELQKKDLPDCRSDKPWNTVNDMGKFWYDSGAEQWIEEYINAQKDHTRWAQNLYRDLFKDTEDGVTAKDFSCEQPGDRCTHGKTCKEFNDIGKGSLYYVFESLENWYTWWNQLSHEFTQQMDATAGRVSTIRKGLNIKPQSPSAELDAFSILGAAFSIASAAGTPVNMVAGPLAGISGIMYMASGTQGSGPVPPNDDVDAEGELQNFITDTRDLFLNGLKTLMAAEVGKPGQSQNAIPENMRVGDAKYKNPAVRVLGWGSWLTDNPLEGMDAIVASMRDNMDKAVLWQMARRWRGLYAVVRDDISEARCRSQNGGKDRNNQWDDIGHRCLDILAWYPKDEGVTFGGNKDIYFAWDKWGMDPLKTIRNAVNCWEGKDGHVGTPDTSIGSLTSSSPYDLPCFFAMPVLKGNYSDVGKGSLWLAANFPGQQGQAGKLWPKSRCKEYNQQVHNQKGATKDCSDLDVTDDEYA